MARVTLLCNKRPIKMVRALVSSYQFCIIEFCGSMSGQAGLPSSPAVVMQVGRPMTQYVFVDADQQPRMLLHVRFRGPISIQASEKNFSPCKTIK